MTAQQNKNSRRQEEPPCHCQHQTTNTNNNPRQPPAAADRHSVHDRLDRYQERVTGITRRERDLIPYLAQRCYHLPGNSYCDDWLQYFQNNHPLFGMCCHHRLHPIRFGMRIWHLIGSIMFGLSMTNVMWLYFFFQGTDHEEAAITISLNGFDTTMQNITLMDNSTILEQAAPEYQVIEITKGMAFLWTFGSTAHAMFDNTIWYISACVCCLGSKNLKKFKCCGTYCVIFFVLLVTAVATMAVLLRTSIEEAYEQAADSIAEQQGEQSSTSYLNVAGVEVPEIEDDVAVKIQAASAYTFLVSYAVELALAYIVYYPVVGTILFSGCFGCGKVPVLGGRPYEVNVEEAQKRKAEAKKKRKKGRATRTDGDSDDDSADGDNV